MKIKQEILDWLLNGDPAIQRLVSKYLLDAPIAYAESGMIDRYLKEFDPQTGLWGGGVYGPKWISTHYTLRELKYLEINPQHPYYLQGLRKVMDGEWRTLDNSKMPEHQDVCVVAMVVSLACYAKIDDIRINEMMEYLLKRQMSDGGWNCSWDSRSNPAQKSSLHTTLSVLEAFYDYKANGNIHFLEAIETSRPLGEDFILRKQLLRSERTGEIIHEAFLVAHFPTRWKYDSLRALEYFARSKHPYDNRMEEALTILKKHLQKGAMPKGLTYSGRRYFSVEDQNPNEKASIGGRFNTYRGLYVLKWFD